MDMIGFAKIVKNYVNNVVMTILSLDEVDIKKARITVEEKIGVEFRTRPYF